MKLLFDENVSPRLVAAVDSHFPGSLHVRDAGLRGASDASIWSFAAEEGYTIVSKDTDFRERGFVAGPPPRVIWLNVGTAGTEAITQLLLSERERIVQFDSEVEASLLILSTGPTGLV